MTGVRALPTRVQTDRLILRTWTPEDRPPLAAMNADPEVMAHIAGGPLDRDASDAMVAGIERHWARHGFGLYAVELRDDGRLAGFVGVHHHPDLPEAPEIGWRLARPVWGRGLATEGAAAVRDLAFKCLDLPALVSATTVSNLASARVMRKLGMRFVREEPGRPQPTHVYRLDRPGPGR